MGQIPLIFRICIYPDQTVIYKIITICKTALYRVQRTIPESMSHIADNRIFLAGGSSFFPGLLFLSAAFFGLFAILTIVIKYLQLLIQLIHKRKNYSFESIEKLTK